MKSKSFRLRGFVSCALVAALTLAVAPAACAGALYSAGAEAPTFTVGPLAGEDGWSVFGTTAVLVENTLAQSGSPAVPVEGSAASQSGPYHSGFSAGPLLQLSAGIYITSSSSQTKRQIAGLDSGLVPFLGGIDILNDGNNDQIEASSAGFPVVGMFTYNAWNHVSLLFNFTTRAYNFSLNGVLLASNVPFCGDNGLCSGEHLSSYSDGLVDTFGGGSDKGHIDNYSEGESPVPEPSSFALFGTGIFGLAGALRRKLKF